MSENRAKPVAAVYVAILSLLSCTTTPPPNVRTWSGSEREVVPLLLNDTDPATVLTFHFENGAYFILDSLRANPPDGYCYRRIAERNPRRDGSSWMVFDEPPEEGAGCSLFRGVVTVWEGDGRAWR